MSIHVRHVSKRFGHFAALDDVTLEVPEGALLALLGPSGSGKTTLLRIIAGLEIPDSGEVLAYDKDVTHHAVRDRNVGFVFQHYALFRHMTVFENVAFGLRVRGWSNTAIQARVQELLQLVRLGGLEQRYPTQLSGGQRQRVALVRALAAQPKVLLLDEPFGALDARVRQELRLWLRRLHDNVGVTSIFVTHDQEEAFEVADQVVVMRAGRVEQIGSPEEVFESPANAFVMDFLGHVNVFHGRVQSGRAVLVTNPTTAPRNGEEISRVEVACPEYADPEARPAMVYVRPHELEIDRTADTASSLRAKILHINPAGSVTRLQLHALEFDLEIHVDISPSRYAELSLKPGELVYVSPRRVRVFVPDYVI